MSIDSDLSESILNYYCNDIEEDAGEPCASHYSKYYTTAYNEDIKYSTYGDALNQLLLDGYIIENQIDNYVCFGSDEISCPTDNLYRIIGIFIIGIFNNDGYKIKLIKSNYADSYLLGTDGDYAYSYNYDWSGNRTLWEDNSLNQINLNTNFINNMSEDWADYNC